MSVRRTLAHLLARTPVRDDVLPAKYTRPTGRVIGLKRLSAGFEVASALSLPRTPTLLSAISRPETAPINAVIDPITRGVLLRKALSPEPASSDPFRDSGSLTARHR